MTPDNWKRAQQIFEAALSQPAIERHLYVRQACDGDPDLESQILRLLDADAKPDGVLDHPVLAIDHLPPIGSGELQLASGEIIASRFKIVRLIGAGGMGQVYEAQDLDLSMRIALKTIRPEISSNAEVLARFKQEVKLTRRITHPNVCRTFDLQKCSRFSGTQLEEITFLTMEFLDGETLRDFLRKKGTLGQREAFPIIVHMANALSAAHDLGIIHRDVKPSNAILVPSPKDSRTVITDFGLACFLLTQDGSTNAISSITNTGQGIGTLAYMAPEQLEGAETSPATDIYAFGLVMYEMLTGSRAFPDNLPFGGIASRLKRPPPSPKLLAPELDEQWEAAILRCLQPDPRARFQSVKQVIEAISASAGFPKKVEPHAVIADDRTRNPWPWTLTRFVWIRRLVILLVAVLALSPFVRILRFNRMKPESSVSPGSNILLTAIRNDTGEKYFDGVTDLMRNQLSQSAHFNLSEPNRVRNVLQQMTRNPDSQISASTAREVALRIGARRVIFGAVSKLGDSYVLDLVIEQPDTQPERARAQWDNHWNWREQSQPYQEAQTIPAGPFDTVRKSSEWIRNQVGEAGRDIAASDVPPQDVTTDKWDALSEFGIAERFASAQQREQALVALSNAVKADPHFALAHMRMGDLLASMGRFEEAYKAYGSALGEQEQRRLTRREKDRITGLRALDANDFEAAENAFHDYTVYYPTDYLSWFYRAYPLMKLGRTEEAIATLKKAMEIDPSRVSAPAHIARCFLILGQHEEAARWILLLRKAGHQDDADDIEGELAYLKGEYVESARLFGQLQKSNDALYRTWSYSLRARVAAEQGQLNQASQLLNDGIKADISEGDSAHRADKLIDLAFIALKQGRFEECLKNSKQAIALDSSPQRFIAAAVLLGRAAAASDTRVKARTQRELRDILSKAPNPGINPIGQILVHRLRGEELLARGQLNAAVSEFEIASQLEAPATDREYLARALLPRSRHKSDHPIIPNDSERALAENARFVSAPGAIWQWPLDFFPGYQSDRVFSFVQLSFALHKVDAGVRTQLVAYIKSHVDADKGLADVEQANRLFHQTEFVNVH